MGLGKWFNTKAFNLFALPTEGWGIKLKVVRTKYNNRCNHRKMTCWRKKPERRIKGHRKRQVRKLDLTKLLLDLGLLLHVKGNLEKGRDKDFETPTQSSYVDHSKAGPISASSPSMGFPTASLDAVKDLKSFFFFLIKRSQILYSYQSA